MDIVQHNVRNISLDHSKLESGTRVLKIVVKGDNGEVLNIKLFSDEGPIPIMVSE